LTTFLVKNGSSKRVFSIKFEYYKWSRDREMFREETEEVILQALSHRERRNVLKIINARPEGALYSDILGEIGLPTGTLNYHLKQLEGLIERDGDRRYHLTPLGERAMMILRSVTEGINGSYERYLSAAHLSQDRNIHPTVTMVIYMGIAFDCLLLFVWGYIGYIGLTEGAPWIVYVVLAVLLALGVLGLVGMIRALKTAPAFVRKLERRLGVV